MQEFPHECGTVDIYKSRLGKTDRKVRCFSLRDAVRLASGEGAAGDGGGAAAPCGGERGDLRRLGVLLLSLAVGEAVGEWSASRAAGLPPQLRSLLALCVQPTTKRMTAARLLRHGFLRALQPPPPTAAAAVDRQGEPPDGQWTGGGVDAALVTFLLRVRDTLCAWVRGCVRPCVRASVRPCVRASVIPWVRGASVQPSVRGVSVRPPCVRPPSVRPSVHGCVYPTSAEAVCACVSHCACVHA